MAAVVLYARGGLRHELPDAVIDALLLKRFPGRTLEELDGLDWGRHQRAVEAQMRLDIEELRAQSLKGKASAKDLPESVWEMIREHDALVEGNDDG